MCIYALGCAPFLVVDTNRINIFLVGDPYVLTFICLCYWQGGQPQIYNFNVIWFQLDEGYYRKYLTCNMLVKWSLLTKNDKNIFGSNSFIFWIQVIYHFELLVFNFWNFSSLLSPELNWNNGLIQRCLVSCHQREWVRFVWPSAAVSFSPGSTRQGASLALDKKTLALDHESLKGKWIECKLRKLRCNLPNFLPSFLTSGNS